MVLGSFLGKIPLDNEVEVVLLAQSPTWLIIFLTDEVQSEISWELDKKGAKDNLGEASHGTDEAVRTKGKWSYKNKPNQETR